MKANTEAPDKLSAAIHMALKDQLTVEKIPGVMIDMDFFHSPQSELGVDGERVILGGMSSKNNPVDSLKEIADHFDQIKGMNHHLTATQILETISKATGQTLSNVKKRWKLIIGVEWPVIDYLERGVIGMNRAALLVENNMSIEERMQALEQSLDENITDAEFKEWIMRFLEKREGFMININN